MNFVFQIIYDIRTSIAIEQKVLYIKEKRSPDTIVVVDFNTITKCSTTKNKEITIVETKLHYRSKY